MKGLLTGVLAFFVGIGSFFHGGTPAQQQTKNDGPKVTISITPPTTLSGTPPVMPSGSANRQEKNNRQTNMLMGTVSIVTDTSVTIKDMRGESTTIILNDETIYKNGSKSDIVVNSKVAIKLKQTTDSSKVALSIEINPTLPSGMPSGQPPAGGPNGNKPGDRGVGGTP